MKTPYDLKKEISQHYTDVDGLITVDRDPGKWSTGNGLMHLGLVMCMYKALGILNHLDQLKFAKAVKEVEVKPGLYHRNPGREDQNGHDDLIGVSAGSMSVGERFHKDIAKHGITHFFIWNNDGKLKAQDFLGRQVFYMCFLMSAFLPFFWITFLKNLVFKPKSYSILLHYMMLEGISSIYSGAKTFRNNHVGTIGLSEECKRYFGESHPIYELAKHVERSEV